jgi:predicted Zn-dependent peptidase
MINFKKLEGPYGIPIYFQKLPEIVESAALEWVIFTGAGDDKNINADGVHHWFEHVPFRGTKKFPGGYAAIAGPFTRYGGDFNAYTHAPATAYHAHVQLFQWKQALEVITDLWSQPLLTDEGIDAERTIIFEEIRKTLSTARGSSSYHLLNHIWPNHPLGHYTLGTEESLKSITPEQLRQAHKLGYDRSRATLFISGNISEKEIIDYVTELSAIMPNNGLSERRVVASFGPLPAWELGKETVVETTFPSSVVYVLFPQTGGKTTEELIFNSFLAGMLSEGDLDSPLYRIVREERKLAYGVNVSRYVHPDGGWMGFVVETKTDNIEKAKQAFIDVLKDPEIRSKERFDKVKDAIYSHEKMRAIDCALFNDSAVDKLTFLNKVLSDEEYNSVIEKIKLEDVCAAFDAMTPNKAHTYIYRGNGKS